MSGVGEGATPLMYACQQSREKEVLDILARKPSTAREVDRTKKTPLHYCAENLNTNCAEALLRVAPDTLNAPDEDGYSPLHLAVIAGNKPLIQLLLSRGADVNALDHEKHSVVHWATVCGEQEALEMVLRAGARISTADLHGGFPLHYAAQMCGPGADMHGDSGAALDILRTLLAFGADVDERDKDGRQPILWAASAGSAEAILTLVKAGAKVEAADKDGLTALHCAASRGHTDCLETLIALCGAHVDTIDINGCTALFYSTTLGHADATQLLLSLGADPNRQDRKGRTPAHCGAAKGQLETLRLLLASDANLWLRNVKGDLPLHEAVASGRRDLVRWLLNQRPDAVNAANNDGKCPIHVAAINNNVDMVKILLDAGSLVNPVLRSNKGVMMTPLDAALHRGHRSCAKYLQLHGGVPRTKLTEASAALRGSAPSRVEGDAISTERSTYGRLPVAGTITYTASPRFAGSHMHINVGGDDAAIQHVERIEVPVCQLRHYEVNSSDEDDRHRRRRRRRRSERRRKDSAAEEGSDDDDASHDCGSRPRRKSSKRRSSNEENRKSRKRSKEVEESSWKSKRRDYSETSEDESESPETKKESLDVSEEDVPKKSKRKIHTGQLEKGEKQEKSKSKTKKVDDPREPNVKPSTETPRIKKNGSKDNPLPEKDVKITPQKAKKVKSKKNVKEEPFSKNSVESSKNTILEASTKVDKDGEKKENQISLKESSHSSSDDKRNSQEDQSTHESPLKTDKSDRTAEVRKLISSLDAEKVDSVADAETNVETPKMPTKPQSPEEKLTERIVVVEEVEKITPLLEAPSLPQPDSSLDEGNDTVKPETVQVEAEVHQTALGSDEGGSLDVDQQYVDFSSAVVTEEGIGEHAKDKVAEETGLDLKENDTLSNIVIPDDVDTVLIPDSTAVVQEEGTSEDSHESPPTRVTTARRRSVVSEKGLIGILGDDEVRLGLDETTITPRRVSIQDEEEQAFQSRSRRQSLVFGELVGGEEMDEMLSERSHRGRTKSQGESEMSSRRRRGSLFTKTESEEREERALRMADVDTVIKGVALEEHEPRSASVGDESGGSTRHEDSSVLPDSGIEPSPRHERRTPSQSPRRRIPRLCKKGRNEENVAPVSVTRAVQNTIRKYHLERKIFYQLLELKRIQIRAGRANEQVLVKRLVDEYQRSCQIAGLQRYNGLYVFRQFERFLYDQLHTLQAGAQIVIPQLRPNDDIETLSAILKRTRVELLDDIPDNPTLCTRGTHRCHHAAHAYTGIPCAAYITKLNHHTMPKDKRAGFLPLIEPAFETRPSSKRGSDRPVTLELVHGREKQVISLPTERLDRNKRYYVTFTIKGGDPTPPQTESPAGERKTHQEAESF